MILTIDSVAINNRVISVDNEFLDLQFREERRLADGSLKIKQRVATGKLIKNITIPFLTESEFVSLEPKFNNQPYTVSLSGSGHDFSGSYVVGLSGYSDSFQGAKSNINLTLKPA